ncbi:MAG: hypothetical protein Q8P24_16625 [Desulfobacterales bacterium]|nr:hypothetical protein [Desulfobacterales bacterium]
MGDLTDFPCVVDDCYGLLWKNSTNNLFSCRDCGKEYSADSFRDSLNSVISPKKLFEDWLERSLTEKNKKFLDALSAVWGGMEGPISVLVTADTKIIPSPVFSDYSIAWMLSSILYAFYDYDRLQFVTVDAGVELNEFKHHNLILLCGPQKNPITDSVMKEMVKKKSLAHFFDGHTLVYNGERWPQNGKQNGMDHGLVVKNVNPFDESKKVFIFAGCHSPGTLAASLTLVTRSIIPIINQLYNTKSFELRVKAFLEKGSNISSVKIESPKAVSQYLPESEISIDLDDIPLIRTLQCAKALSQNKYCNLVYP